MRNLLDATSKQGKAARSDEYWRQQKAFQERTPEEALENARERLSEIDAAISQEADEETIAGLKKKRVLVEELIGKLGKMVD